MAVTTTEVQEQQKPTHPGLFRVVRQGPPDQFRSKLVAERDFANDQVIARLEGLTPGPKRYSSVQVSATEHVELNSDLVYMNHSCDPSTHMDVDRMVVVAIKDIKAGDELTFFYPSTEWDMAQPFACWCGAPQCIRTVTGAKHLPTETLNRFTLCKHIKELVAQRDSSSA